MNRMMKDKKMVFFLIAPGLLFIIGIVFVPIILSFYYSLTDWRSGATTFNFIGPGNYWEIITSDGIFWSSLRNSILLGICLIFIQHPLAIIVAMLIQYSGKWERFLRICIFLPSVISIFISAKLWSMILNTQFGLINQLLDKVGLASLQRDWLGEQVTAIASIILVCMWTGFGYAFILYYAGVKGVSDELLEAATLDGSSKLQVNTLIILPLLKPIIRVNVVLATTAAFKQMEVVYLLTTGGPANSTQFMSTYLYSKAFRENMFGYGNAVSILLLVICLAITAVLNHRSSLEEGGD